MFLGTKRKKLNLTTMTIRSKADWLRGCIESLEYSDSISQKQINLLKQKINELLEEIDEGDFGGTIVKTIYEAPEPPLPEPTDDLPF